jgi:acyl-CoA reductase-like NAD-dependent aldehyde dehydrogenase
VKLSEAAVSVLDAFQVELLSALRPYMEEATFAAGETIFERGDPSDAFYVVDEGEIRLEAHSVELDSENVLAYVGPGSFLGEASLLGGTPRSLNAVAQSDVTAHKITRDGLKRLFTESPEAGIDVLRALARDTALKLQDANQRLAETIASEAPDPEVDRMVAAALAAQREFASWPEDRVDELLGRMAEAVADRAEELAQATVEETTIGNPLDKVFKIRFAALGVYGTIAGETASGPLRTLEDRKVTEIAAPMGVVFGLVPVTNPVPTFINKSLICLKGRNAVILSCQRASQGVASRVGEVVQEALREGGAPVDLVQWVRGRTSRQRTARFMRHPDVAMILATGGPSMVKAAYSAGKPAIGVGAGNAPCWVAADANPESAARSVIKSKALDYGLICGAEQHLVVDAEVVDEFSAALEREGAMLLDEDETRKFVAACFDESGHLKLPFVGRSAEVIAQGAGFAPNPGASLLVFKALADFPEETFGKERLAPVLSLWIVDGDAAALDLCKRLLGYEGAGHTAVIHSGDRERIENFAREMPASRVLVNVPAALGCCGVATGLQPSLTLGCGTFGGNSTTDNVTYSNLLNIKRMAEPVM